MLRSRRQRSTGLPEQLSPSAVSGSSALGELSGLGWIDHLPGETKR
jgi:hypothetical protein